MMRKVAYWALRQPADANERQVFWNRLTGEEDGGVRGWLAYELLQQAEKGEIHRWINFIEDCNWSVRWCASEYFQKYPEYPVLEKTHDPGEIHDRALPVSQWYQNHY
jgi:serine protease AprX